MKIQCKYNHIITVLIKIDNFKVMIIHKTPVSLLKRFRKQLKCYNLNLQRFIKDL